MSDTRDLRQPRNAWALFEGGSFLMLGMLGLALLFLSHIAWTDAMGVVLLSGGAVGLISRLTMHPAPGLRFQLMAAFLAATTGALLLGLSRSTTLTQIRSELVVLIYVLGHGTLSLCYAFAHRRAHGRGWGWMLIASLGEITLGALLLQGLAPIGGRIDSPALTPVLLVLDRIDRPLATQVLPAVTLTWNGFMLVMMGRTGHKDQPAPLPSTT